MRVYTNPIDLAKAWEKRSDLYVKNLVEIHVTIVKESFFDFIGLLSGQIKETVLRQMGHPFAKDHIILRGKGGFKQFGISAIKMRGVSSSYKKKYLGLFHLGGNKKAMVINSLMPKSKLYDPSMAKLVGPQKSQLDRKGNLNVFPINEQTGELINSILLENKGGPEFTYYMYATSPHQIVMTEGGTKHMVDRKIFGEFGMLRRFHKARLSGLTRMLRNVNKKVFP